MVRIVDLGRQGSEVLELEAEDGVVGVSDRGKVVDERKVESDESSREDR